MWLLLGLVTMILGMPAVTTEVDNPSQSILRQVEGFLQLFFLCAYVPKLSLKVEVFVWD